MGTERKTFGDREEDLGVQMIHWPSLDTLKGQVKQTQLEKSMVTRDEGLDG